MSTTRRPPSPERLRAYAAELEAAAEDVEQLTRKRSRETNTSRRVALTCDLLAAQRVLDDLQREGWAPRDR